MSSASAWAALSTSNGLRPDAGLPNSSMAIASSCGSCGVDVSSILGAREVPVMSTSITVEFTVVVAAKSSSGSMVVAVSSATLPRVKSRRWPARLKFAAPQGEIAEHRWLAGIAADGELAADLGIEAAAAHEHCLRRLDLDREPDRRPAARLKGGRRGRPRRAGIGLAGAVDLAHRQDRIARRLTDADRDLRPVDRRPVPETSKPLS